MVVKLNNMEKQVRSELKGGKGDIHFLNSQLMIIWFLILII
jgi:hypothetical protein